VARRASLSGDPLPPSLPAPLPRGTSPTCRAASLAICESDAREPVARAHAVSMAKYSSADNLTFSPDRIARTRRAVVPIIRAARARLDSLVSFQPRGIARAVTLSRATSIAETAADIDLLPSDFDDFSDTGFSIMGTMTKRADDELTFERVGSVLRRVLPGSAAKSNKKADGPVETGTPARCPAGIKTPDLEDRGAPQPGCMGEDGCGAMTLPASDCYRRATPVVHCFTSNSARTRA
jgi:hypothetical protein